MKINRRHFVGILYDCILFEHASPVPVNGTHTLSLEDLADTFAFIADFYKHNRSFMDIPCDQFITRNQLHTVAGLIDYIENLSQGVFEIFPRSVELREETPSFASSSSANRDQKRRERFERQGSHPIHGISSSSNDGIDTKSKIRHDPFDQTGRSWTVASLYTHHRGGHDHLQVHDSDTDLDDEYSIVIPGLSKSDVQSFLWEYAYIPEDYQDDIATLIRYLRRDEWMMQGSKGSIVSFDWNLEGVQKFTKNHNQSKIQKVEQREQEEAKKAQEAVQREQEEWNRQQELIREQEAMYRMRVTDDFIWKMHKKESTELEMLIKSLEAEISEYFGFCFVALAAVGSYATGTCTHHSDLDLTLKGDIKHITISALVEALRHFGHESITVMAANNSTQHAGTFLSLEPIPSSIITFLDPRTETTCYMTLNEPLAIYRSKLIRTYALIDPRFDVVMVALKHLATKRKLVSGSMHRDRNGLVPLGSYALALMLITFLQTENPPILPKLQQQQHHQQQTAESLKKENDVYDGDHRPIKETMVQGINCSFDHDWKFYQKFGIKNPKSAAELLMEFCRFFGYVFDYESKEVNARVGAFRWRSDLMTNIQPTNGPLSPSSLISPSLSSFSSALPSRVTGTATATASTLPCSQSNVDSISSTTNNSNTFAFHVMDPFVVGFNVTFACRGELVRTVKKCFQETYGALVDGDINLAFS